MLPCGKHHPPEQVQRELVNMEATPLYFWAQEKEVVLDVKGISIWVSTSLSKMSGRHLSQVKHKGVEIRNHPM